MLSAAERRILESVCEALVPPPLEDVAPRGDQMADFVEEFVIELPTTSALGFRAGLWALASAARLRRGRALHRQDRAERARLLRELEASRLTPLRLSLKVVCGLGLMALYSDARVRERLSL